MELSHDGGSLPNRKCVMKHPDKRSKPFVRVLEGPYREQGYSDAVSGSFSTFQEFTAKINTCQSGGKL